MNKLNLTESECREILVLLKERRETRHLDVVQGNLLWKVKAALEELENV